MTKVTLGGKTYELAMSLYAMDKIEEEFGDLREAITKFRGKNRNLKMVRKMFRIMANAARHARKQPEDITGDEIDDIGLKGLEILSEALKQVMDDSMKAETVNGGLADDEAADVYAEEMERQEKNGLTGGGSASGNTTDTP